MNDNARTERVGNICESCPTSQKYEVYDTDGLSPTLVSAPNSGPQPPIIVAGNISNGGFGQHGRVYDTGGISPAVESGSGAGGPIPPIVIDDTYSKRDARNYDTVAPTIRSERDGLKVAEPMAAAMRGRNPDNPSDRTAGIPTEQRIEVHDDGICNTVTTCTKDCMVLEPDTVGIKQATKQGYIECEVGGVADFAYPDSKLRRGRVQGGGQISPTLTAGDPTVCRIEKAEPVTTQGNDISSCIRSSIFKQGERNIEKNVTDNMGYEGIVEPQEQQYRIRKLTPLECWRLQNFSDEDFHRAETVCSNSALYREAGNSIVVACLSAIFSQLGINGIKKWNDRTEAEREELINPNFKEAKE